MEEDVQLTKRQIDLLEKDMNYRFRPWLYFIGATPRSLRIKEWNEDSKKGLEILFYLNFINLGSVPARSYTAYVTFGNKIKNDKAHTSIFPGHAVLPQEEIRIMGDTFMKDSRIEDNSRLSDILYVTVRLEYEYRSGSNITTGFYEGQFGVKEIYFEDIINYRVYTPSIMDRKDDFG